MNAMSLAARKVDDRSRLNATVEARVTPHGLAGVTRRLESMQISGTVIHDNYFTIRANDLYRILVSDHSRRGQQTCDIGFSP